MEHRMRLAAFGLTCVGALGWAGLAIAGSVGSAGPVIPAGAPSQSISAERWNGDGSSHGFHENASSRIAVAELDLTALRSEGLRLRAADGGALTPAHRADLQAKLNAVAQKYRVALVYPN